MNHSSSGWFQNLEISDLEPIVCQILNQPAVEVLGWHIRPASGGAAHHTGRGFGVFHVSGTARYHSSEVSWSAFVKVLGPSDDVHQHDPTHPDYWKREALVYQSGVLKHLPGNIAAPRCYAIQELPGEKTCLWLEAIHEIDGSWSMEQHRLTARHLGQFNGAYLAGYPLPERAQWMLPGRTPTLLEKSIPDKADLLLLCKTEMGNRWLTPESIDRVVRIWENRQRLLAALDRLPTCFCHHDAFRRNLMLRQMANGTVETVAIDWSYTGLGKVGQEIGATVGVDLLFMEVPANQARELDQAVFAAYSAGLRDAGWQGDLRLARFGYTVTAALAFGIDFTMVVASLLQSPEAAAVGEAIVGRPIDDILNQYAVVLPFLLDLGDEALALLPDVTKQSAQ